MMEDELIKIWQSSPMEEQIKFDKSRLMLDMQSSLNRFDKLVKCGILIEQGAMIIAIPVFIFYIYFVPFVLSKIASILIVTWGIWYFFKLKEWKKKKPNNLKKSYLDYLYESRNYLVLLKKWGDNAIYWYILPTILSVILFLFGPLLEGKLNNKLIAILFIVTIATGVVTYFWGKWRVKTQFVPRLKKVEELIAVMEE
ncbi:hypothetical protein [uncultured Kriegella sp.]|uniref:hypothetical protein n=1 Tax=uncultured Kriegella sp. TaxID=1798910 RepID=UPI0030DC4DB5|tara:strand:- start:97077 stop:97670 length:594 start_codon:yes stop_codon:yes gene_type:complete